MKTLKMIHTKAALEGLDAFIDQWNKIWDGDLKDINNKRANELIAQYEEAENKVRRAFHEDTKDRNSLDNCMIVGITWLREMVAKHYLYDQHAVSNYFANMGG